MNTQDKYPLGTKVKITQKDEVGIGTGSYEVSTNFGVVVGYCHNGRSIDVELTSGTLVDSKTYNHNHVVHPLEHWQCTTEIVN